MPTRSWTRSSPNSSVSGALPDVGLTRAEVRARLVSFVARWDQRPGNEQQEAQRFLLELLDCYGVDIKADFTFEHHYPDGTRADLFWPGFLLVEMKSASETARLDLHRPQAFGCGNFLYVAYRELRKLEQRLLARVAELHRVEGRAAPEQLPRMSLANMKGIERDPFAAALARVVLWIGHKQAVDTFGLSEPALPLPALTGIVQGDALEEEWPECEAVVGNPPFHGTKTMRERFGGDYLKLLERRFGVGVTDYCVYWFRKAHAHLTDGQRAGLVATNSIGEGKNREAALDHIVATGGSITNAIRSQQWPGEANVFVSIVNWVKAPIDPVQRPVLGGEEVEGITSELRPGLERPSDEHLAANRGRQFFGVVPGAGGEGFLLDTDGALGVLQSRVHTVWATERSTKLETRPRYTVKSFASFPWPVPPTDLRESIAALAARIVDHRRELCWGNGIGLTKLYNSVEEGGHHSLADLHVQLDDHVAEAYGWPTAAARDDDAIVRGLGVLNRAISDGEIDYDPFDRPSRDVSLFD